MSTLPVPTPSHAITPAQTSANPALVYLASLPSPESRRVMASALNRIADMVKPGATLEAFPWEALRFEHVNAIRSALMERYKPATVNRHLAALKGVLKAAWRMGLISDADYMRAVDVKGVRGETLPAGRMLDAGEVAAVVAACKADASPAGARDAALLAVLLAGGLRRAEVVALNVEDYNPETGELTVRHGKGRKERVVWLTNGARRAVNAWLEVRGPEPGPLFLPVNKGGRIIPKRMTSQAIYNALQKRAKQAGVTKFTPHDMRRTFASTLLDNGADLAVVSALMGHANITTTARYDRRGEEAKRAAANLFHFPF